MHHALVRRRPSRACHRVLRSVLLCALLSGSVASSQSEPETTFSANRGVGKCCALLKEGADPVTFDDCLKEQLEHRHAEHARADDTRTQVGLVTFYDEKLRTSYAPFAAFVNAASGVVAIAISTSFCAVVSERLNSGRLPSMLSVVPASSPRLTTSPSLAAVRQTTLRCGVPSWLLCA